MTRQKKVPFLKRYRLRFARRRPPAAMWEALLVVLFGAVMIYAYSFAKKVTYGAGADGFGPEEIVRVQVLNGCGIRGVASEVTDHLRTCGDPDYRFDVIDQGNFATFDVKETLILDRNESSDAARRIAAVLGVDGDRVLSQPLTENVLDLDVTVLLGRDAQSLNLSETKRRP